MATPPSKGKLLYHITHIDNISSILKNGLLYREELNRRGMYNFRDIADHEIIAKRENYKSRLSKYVPFHFFAKNPFDCAVCNKYDSKNLVIITIRRELHKTKKMFVIPSHPLDTHTPEIYNYDDGFEKINWNILDMQGNRDYNNPEIKKACMAECLIENIVKPTEFFKLYVKDEASIKDIKILDKDLGIEVNPNMFL